ncbi:Dynein regulatory complex subunit 3 [Cardamine amara subsp. amara]|uniref:Dynein regulatory complex subunit 3 n=1 Tax=Cardamine amara subsp. amara TaxID=228776 RepID=A0ABD1AA10_CARAN
MAIVTGDRYIEKLQKFLEDEAESLLEETIILKLNPVGLHYLHLRLESLRELERMLSGAPVDYLRAYVSDLGDYRALEQLRRILRILTSLKVVSTLPSPTRDPTPLSLIPFGRLKILELRGCDLSTSPAKGLLQLRHSLEKIICHNSTDALRHVFASRIAEITNSPEWNKLAVISCACNRLVLMDESLQLLPAAESLDLSRNKFAKVDNLRRCTKLKHLDLGFNHLRTVSHLSEVSCNLVKLVLRNNALTTLRGIENLKSLEGLDVSYNIISNFSELEFLWSFSSLKELWLEGNPVCCARWYRAHVFSYIALPDVLKLDGKHIGTREFWKRQIIVAHRQSEPASYGFYSTAREEANEEGTCNTKKKKICRLAPIDSEEESIYVNSDQESASCDHENKENVKCDQEAHIFDLIKKVEHLKKERSVLWLREFKEWMDHSSEDFADVSKDSLGINLENKYYTKIREIPRRHTGTPRYASGSLRASRDKSYRKSLKCNGSCVDHEIGRDDMKYVEGNETQKITNDISSLGPQSTDLNLSSDEMEASVEPDNLFPTTTLAKEKLAENGNMSTLDITQDIMGLFSSSTYPGSPPHYQKDVLHRRHNLVEEILQFSADSYSVASSDSTSSCSEDDNYDSESEYSNHEEGSLTDLLNVNRLGEEIPGREPKGTSSLDSQLENGSIIKTLRTDESVMEETTNGKLDSGVNQICHLAEKSKSKSKRRPIKRYVSLQREESCITNGETSLRNDADISDSSEDEWISDYLRENSLSTVCSSRSSKIRFLETKRTHEEISYLVEEYFSAKLSDSSSQETCRTYMSCDLILQKGSTYKLREAVLLLSSQDKLYVLLLGVSTDYEGSTIRVLCSHKVKDLQDVSVGLGLQFVRLRFWEDAEYIFVTKCIEKATELLNVIQVFDSQAKELKCSLQSLENIQVDLFEKEICGGVKLSIFQYNVLHFQSSTRGEVSWRWRSLYVAGRRLFICNEDFAQLSSRTASSSSSSPYFLLDSCCCISDISEMIIESQGSVVSLKIKDKRTVDSVTWKLKWCSIENTLKFVALLKALHPDSHQWPLAV